MSGRSRRAGNLRPLDPPAECATHAPALPRPSISISKFSELSFLLMN